MSDKLSLPATIKAKDPLKPKHRAFIDAMVANGGNLTKAALTAGYPVTSAKSQGSRLWSSTLIKDAYKAAIWDKIARTSSIALNSLADLAENAESEHAKILAAKEILARAGFNEPQQHSLSGGVTINIGLGNSDTGATQAPTIDVHAVDITELNDDMQGDE